MNNGVTIKVMAGQVSGVHGPVKDIVTDPEMLDISVPPGTVFAHSLPPKHTVFAYVLSGEGYFDEKRDAYAYEVVGQGWSDVNRCCICQPETVILFEHAGDQVKVTTMDKPIRFLLVSGKPLHEPVAWYGPIVMNTQEELRLAFEEFKAGTFVK
jgi:quercetin 2,3-dioxygenase